MKDRTRVFFDFDRKAVVRLDELVKELGAASRAEVVRRALRLLDIAVQGQREEGGDRLVVQKANGKTEAIQIV